MWFNYHKIELSRHFWQVGVFETRYKRSEEHTSELQSRLHLVCRLLLEKKNNNSVFLVSLTHSIPAARTHVINYYLVHICASQDIVRQATSILLSIHRCH